MYDIFESRYYSQKDAIELYWLGKKYWVNRYADGVINHPSLDPAWGKLAYLIVRFCQTNGIPFADLDRMAGEAGIIHGEFVKSEHVFFDVSSHKLSFYLFCEEELLEFLEKLRKECGKKEEE